MSDGIAPAVDKVGAPEPTAPEAQAGAPTMDTTKPTIAVCPPDPSEKAQDMPVEEPKGSDEAKASHDAKLGDVAKPAVRVPRPVEVVSVPETPVNDATPANGTPRPELNIAMDTDEVEKPQREPIVMIEVQEPLPTPTASAPNSDTGPEPIVDKPVTPNGDPKPAEMTGALQADQTEQKSEATGTTTGEKRKLEDSPADKAVDDASTEKEESEEAERADKKAKVDTTAEAKTNGGAPARGRPGRPKKDKNAPPVVGKTARKTRSQGPVEI